MPTSPATRPIRRTVAFVALANFGYFGVEVSVAGLIGSVSLAADSIDFLEDASLNVLVLLALDWAARRRAQVGFLLAGVITLTSVVTLLLAIGKLAHPLPPDAAAMSLTGLGALLVNAGCTLALARVRHGGGSLTLAAFLSSRNDMVANLAIIVAGVITLWWPTAWPDLVVGFVIFVLSGSAALEVFTSARNTAASGQDPGEAPTDAA